MLALHVLASGSRGNATIVEDVATGRGVLVDCGICKRDLLARAQEAGFDLTHLDAVLITHEHGDHTKGLGVAMRGLAKLARGDGQPQKRPKGAALDCTGAEGAVRGSALAGGRESGGCEPGGRESAAAPGSAPPPVYALEAVQAASADIRKLGESCDVRALALDRAFTFGSITAFPFRTSHDAAGSCGFRFEGAGGDVIGYMTDTGVVLPEAHEALCDVRILALESNHDARMLREGPYPYVVKARIASDRGHLSNDQSAEELDRLLGERLDTVVAMHLSENNNLPSLAERALGEVLARNDHPARLLCASQHMLASVR